MQAMTQETPQQNEPTRAAADESTIDRLFRHTTRTAQYAATVVFVVVAIYLILLIVKNTTKVKLDYVFGNGHAAVLWIVIVSALVGWVLGIATSIILRRRTRRIR
jgi:uncharacterized integral membrane protein